MIFLNKNLALTQSYIKSYFGARFVLFIILTGSFSSSFAANQCHSFLNELNSMSPDSNYSLVEDSDLKKRLENESPIGHPKYLNLGKTEVYTVEFRSGLKAIFKPDPKHWVVANKFQNMNLSNPGFEEAAYIVSRAINLAFVPITIQRSIQDKFGSVQLFVNGETLNQYQVKNLSPEQNSILKDIYVFDYIIQNADRNLSNLLIDGTNVWAIDNGSSFYLSRQITFAPSLNKVIIDSLSFEMWKKLNEIDFETLESNLKGLVSEDRIKELKERVRKLVEIGQTKFKKQIQADLKSQLLKVFTQVYNDPSIYECDYCQKNVSRLFRAFQSKIPNLDPKKFNVIHIANQIVLKSPFSMKGFHVRKGRGVSPRAKWGSYPHFRYHVVLEYDGLIYDFDYSRKPKPVNIKTYINTFFVSDGMAQLHRPYLHGPVSELVAFSIPMSVYMEKKFDELDDWETDRLIYEKIQPTPLKDYLKN